MTTYQFATQLADGITGEDYLDQKFAPCYTIVPATSSEQSHGIDRWFTSRSNGDRFSVEYKTDRTAGRTGNAFIETVSVDTAHKPGWAYTCQARYLIYHIPEPETTYMIPMSHIRYLVDTWRQKYPERRIPNTGHNGTKYHTIGTLVPLDEFEKIAATIT